VETGKRHNIKRRNQPPKGPEIPPPSVAPALKQRWGQLSKKVYEADPLLCPRCGGAMRILALMDQPEVLEKIVPPTWSCGPLPPRPLPAALWPS